MFPDHRGKLEPVEFRHADVDEQDGDVGLQQGLQRFPCGRRLDQVLAELMQNGLVGEQFGRLVVDQRRTLTLIVLQS